MENINYFDLVILVLVALLGLKGLFRGFVKEIFALIGIIGGIYTASTFATDMGQLLDLFFKFKSQNIITLLGFISLLVGFWLMSYAIGATLSKALGDSGFGGFDRMLGFIFGASKIFLLFAVLVYAMTTINLVNNLMKNSFKTSLTLPILRDTGSYIIKLDRKNGNSKMSDNLDQAIKHTTNTLEDITFDALKNQ